jgi:hypothetical protein
VNNILVMTSVKGMEESIPSQTTIQEDWNGGVGGEEFRQQV